MKGEVPGVDAKPLAVVAEGFEGPATRTWRDALRREIRNHKFGYSVLAVALVMGPILIRMIFPSVSIVQAIVGGLAFGVYLALCAVPQKFM